MTDIGAPGPGNVLHLGHRLVAPPELDLVTQGAFEREIALALETSPRVVVDLSSTEFLSLSALSMLERWTERAAQRDRRLVVRRPSPAAARLLTLLREHVALDLEMALPLAPEAIRTTPPAPSA